MKNNKCLICWTFLIFIPILFAFTVYYTIKPSFDEPPTELRQDRSTPPSSFRVFNKSFNLATLENPIRTLVQTEANTKTANKIYQEAVQAGSEIYFKNCSFCHGDMLKGKGRFAEGSDPQPADLQNLETITQSQEAFLFWRIATGGPSLLKEGSPWNSAMPVWHEILNEAEIWQIITFLYDYVEQVPHIGNPNMFKTLTSMRDKTNPLRTKMTGPEIYQFRCAVCHGEKGDGYGIASEFLYPRPRDFTLGTFKYKTSPAELPARDEDIFDSIKYGLNGTSMSAWQNILTDKQIKSLIPVIKRFDISGTWAPEEADEDEDFDDEGRYIKDNFIHITDKEPIEGQIAYSKDSISKGKIVFEKACRQCHGFEGRGNITSNKPLADDWEHRIWPRDLTKPWTWRAIMPTTDAKTRSETIRKIYTRLSIGIPGTPMPTQSSTDDNPAPISLEERWHIANYVYSLRERNTPPSKNTLIKGMNVVSALPTSIDDDAWNDAPATTLRLIPNLIKEERLFTSLSNAITVRVLYNQENIAFLLEMNDRTDSRPGGITAETIQDQNITMRSDAFAIQFPKAESFAVTPVVRKPFYRHGDNANPTTIWYWNAGDLDLFEKTPPKTIIFDANGLDKPLKPRSDNETWVATGKWEQGYWRVLMKRPRKGGNYGDVSFTEGQFIPISFANWDGSNGEIGSKHTLTSWYWLLLPPKMNYYKLYGIPLGVGILTFLLGIILVKRNCG